jgi:DNA-binding transcriptional regulator WhiA
LYEKNISKRIKIPAGARKDLRIDVPTWILKNKQYIVRYLRGLYEAEGSFNVHKPTYTYKFIFTNTNQTLLDNVYNLMKKIGFHPHKSKKQIQISKKDEVYKAVETLKFRKYK